MDNIRKEIGNNIRLLRKSKMLTQEELGERAELSYKYIGEVERGTVNPSVDSLCKICKGLGVEIGDLFPKKDEVIPSFSVKDIQLIKDTIKLLKQTISKVK